MDKFEALIAATSGSIFDDEFAECDCGHCYK